MNKEHAYLSRLKSEYGAVIQWKNEFGNWKTLPRVQWKHMETYRLCPIWLEERLAVATSILYVAKAPVPEHEFKIGQTFYYIDKSGGIPENTWEGTLTDIDMYRMGNAYQSQEEAQVARDRQLAKVRVERRIKALNEGYEKGNISFALTHHKSLTTLITSSVTGCREFQGNRETIYQVLQEMPEDVKLAMGWDSE